MQIIETIISAISAVAAVVAAIIAVVTLNKSRQEQKEGLDRQKKQATLEAYNKLQEQVLDKLNQYKPAEIKAISGNSKSAEYTELSTYLARIEHFCVGLTNDIFDYETFYSLAHGYFDEGGTLYNRMLPLLESKRRGKEYYANIQEVWCKMDKMSKV